MQVNAAPLSIPELNKPVHKALSLWHKSAARGSPLADLLVVQEALAETGGNLRLATNQVLHRAMSTMATQQADLAGLLRVRFLDCKTVHSLAIERNVAEATIYLHQNRAMALLAAAVQGMEQAARGAFQQSMAARLPAPGYVSLVGAAAHLDRLLDLITSPQTPGLILLEGIGGIGKTSLADALVRNAIKQASFSGVGWINAQRQYLHLDGSVRQIPRSVLTADSFIDELADQVLPDDGLKMVRSRALTALQDHLARTPHLIVVDNLEMVEDTERLFQLLRRLSGVSRFLLLSRRCYYGEPDICHYRLGELADADALRLVRQEAERRNLPDLVTAPDNDLQPILATVGGNPLALRLLVGQVHTHPLPTVLSNLSAARGESVEALYTYIYRQAWDDLDEVCRRALLVMPLVAESGGSSDYLAQVSSLPVDELSYALGILVHRNLVDSRGDLMQRRYAIHNLTRSFLLEQVIRWQA